jgi:hypothetical protein
MYASIVAWSIGDDMVPTEDHAHFDTESAAVELADKVPRGDVDVLQTRVPCNLLGMVLGQGSASIFAVLLLAIKTCSASGGATWMLWKDVVARDFGVSGRGFKIGLQLLKKAGVIFNRYKVKGRRAVESMAKAGDSFVLIAQCLLRKAWFIAWCDAHGITKGKRPHHPTMVAFILATKLSPRPMTRAEVGELLGIVDSKTLRRLAEVGEMLGEIATAKGPHGRDWVARPGTIKIEFMAEFARRKAADAEGVGTKNPNLTDDVGTKYPNLMPDLGIFGPGKKRPAYARWKHQHKTSKLGQARATRVHLTPAAELHGETRAARASRRKEAYQAGSTEDAAATLPAAGELTSWIAWYRREKNAGIRNAHGIVTNGNDLDDTRGFITHDKWLGWLARCGDAPEHLTTPHAYREALSLANEIARHQSPGGRVNAWQALPGIAHAAMRRLKKPRTRLNSLAAFAPTLIDKTNAGDRSWAFGIRSTLSAKDERATSALAKRWLDQLQQHEYPVQREALQGTIEVEALHALLQHYGENVVAAGIAAHVKEGSWPTEGTSTCMWASFRPHIEAVANAATAKAA